MKRIVLVADNDADFLDTRAEYLETHGYKVYKATSVEQAEGLLQSVWIHVAVIDIRLRNDADPKDESGLRLARNTDYHAVPKIILTRWPTYQAVRRALGPSVEGLPPAVDFVAKQEGPRAMFDAIERAFQHHVRINSELSIQHSERDPLTFLYLTSLIESGLDDEAMLYRAEELEALFRRLFQKEKSIRIDRLLWQSNHRVALAAFAYADGKKPESLVIVCGQNTFVAEEARRYRDFAPKAPSRNATALIESSETLHYGANAYMLAGSDIENVRSLKSQYDSGTEKSFHAALNTLFEAALVDWHQEKRVVEETVSLDDFYREHLSLTQYGRSEFENLVEAIIRQSLTLGERIELDGGYLKIHFAGQVIPYSDPIPFLYRSSILNQPMLQMNTPGILSGKNILADESGNIWLTDFIGAGLAPSLWNYVSLEAAIRFDWIRTNKLKWLHEVERNLVSSEFSKFYVGDVEASLRKPLRAIQQVRRLASPYLGRDYLSYHLGIFFQAAHRLALFSSSPVLSSLDLGQLTHALLASAMICDLIDADSRNRIDDDARSLEGIWINKSTREVLVNGARVSLRGQSYDLLCDLYDHLDNLRTRREIIEKVFAEKYDETDNSQISRLNTAIHRLREKIEEDPYHPRFLLTEPMLGYKLIRKPWSK